ncbi:MAG: outer membrane protein assembly factor BamB family protein [Armatimonadota bacterium]
MRNPSSRMFLLMFLLILPTAASLADDWPTYNHDMSRSGVTAENLTVPLTAQWIHQPAGAPSPGWADPQPVPVEGILEPPKVKFDDSFYPSAAEGFVFYGSSTENCVRALDAATGAKRWVFFTGGPVRLTPTYSDGKLYFGSDDGFVYCLKAADGALLWQHRVGPTNEHVLGHGRMISLWPVRTGIVVDQGIVYYTGGIFPGERVYIGALSAADGTPVWVNDTVDDGMGGQGNVSPQGYLLASQRNLYVPSGRSLPACFDRADGRFIYQRGDGRWTYGVVGGSYALLAGDQLYGGTGQILGYDQPTGKQTFAWFPGKRLLVSADTSYMLSDGGLTALDRVAYPAAGKKVTDAKFKRTKLVALRPKPADLDKQLAAVDEEAKQAQAAVEACTRFRFDHTKLECMILAGGTLFAGGAQEVLALDARTGKQLWSAPIDGVAKGLAVADQRLLVSTDTGATICFAAGQPPAAPKASAAAPFPKDNLTPVFEQAADTILKLSGVREGYCLVLGSRTGRLAYELARRSKLMVYGVDEDASRIAKARAALCDAGLYGTRVSLDVCPPDQIPYSNYFANLIVSEAALLDGKLPTAPENIIRHLKPCGGVLLLGTRSSAPDQALRQYLEGLKIGEVSMIRGAGTWGMCKRGALRGAGQWTHQYGDPGNTASSEDKILKAPLGVLWYGEPGPDKVPSRHLGNAAPLTINGRVYLQGMGRIMCFDSYNGVMYWERELPGAYRVGMVYDCGNLACDDKSLYVSTGAECHRLDALTGKTLRTYALPRRSDDVKRTWAYVALVGDTLFGSASAKGQQSDQCFAMDTATGRIRWTATGEAIRNNTICVDGGRLFFASAPTPAQRQEALAEKIKELAASKMITPAEAEKELTSADVRLVTAVDTKTGKVAWQRPLDLTDCGPHVLMAIAAKGTLMFSGAHSDGHYWPQFLGGEYGTRRVTVLSAADGSLLWTKPIGHRIRPLVVGDTLFAEPWAFDLKTGEQQMRDHPVTGQPSAWQMDRPGHHCGCISGSPNGLYFRSWSMAYYDLLRDNGVEHFGGQRSGCWINMIPANGLLVVPEASSGCICLVSIHCTTVFQPREVDRAWGGYSTPGPGLPVKHLALNLGAPGDRTASDGTLWLSYPRPYTRMPVQVKADLAYAKGGGVFATAAETSSLAGTDLPWVYTSGARGLTSCTIPLVGPIDGPATYTVRLGFVDTENQSPGQRVFGLKLQGQVQDPAFDIIKAAGSPNRVITREFKGINVNDALKIELTPAAGELKPAQMPLLNSVEIIREKVLNVGMAVPDIVVSDPVPTADATIELSNRTAGQFTGTLRLKAPEGFTVTPAEVPVTLGVDRQLSQPVKLTVTTKGPAAKPTMQVQLVRADGTVEIERPAIIEYLGPRMRVTIPVAADAYAGAGARTTNYGLNAAILVDGGNSAMGDESHNIGYLRFPLNIPGRVLKVTLRIHTAPSEAAESNDSGRICLVDTAWDENKLTYSNKPAPGVEVARLGKVERNVWEERVLKVDLAGKTELNLVLDPTSCDGASYISRQGGTPPELVVEYEAP